MSVSRASDQASADVLGRWLVWTRQLSKASRGSLWGSFGQVPELSSPSIQLLKAAQFVPARRHSVATEVCFTRTAPANFWLSVSPEGQYTDLILQEDLRFCFLRPETVLQKALEFYTWHDT